MPLNLTVTVSDVMIIVATFGGPIVAIQLEKYLERKREADSRRRHIFRTLMSTRASRTSTQHVEALNLIDVEFDGRSPKDKKVRNAWKAYFNQLQTPVSNDTTERRLDWARRDELFLDLLYEMALALGYDFDKTHIKTHVYSPIAHDEIERDNFAIRKGLANILSGNAALPMDVVSLPQPTAEASSPPSRELPSIPPAEPSH